MDILTLCRDILVAIRCIFLNYLFFPYFLGIVQRPQFEKYYTFPENLLKSSLTDKLHCNLSQGSDAEILERNLAIFYFVYFL